MMAGKIATFNYYRTLRLLIILHLASLNVIHCFQQQQNQSVIIDQPTSLPPDGSLIVNEGSTTTTEASLLLSGEEFVDFTEAPMLLFDGTANQDEPKTSDLNATSQPSSDSNPAAKKEENKTTISLPSGHSSNTNETSENSESAELEADDAANQKGSVFNPPQNVSQYMDYIERLFHDLRHQITDLFEPHIPQLIRTSQMVQLSGPCSYDMLRMALALRQFEPWALKMIDSSGKVPEGIFEGSFTALGSYDECLNTIFAPETLESQPTGAGTVSETSASQAPTRGKYCLVSVSPYLPPKPPADRVERMFQEEANRRNYTKDDQFSRLSPMFYYMKFRIGVCIPSSCLDSDMHSISEALSSSLRLNITVPHCRIKQTHPPLTNHQLVGGVVFALVLAAVIGATVADCSRQSKQMASQDKSSCANQLTHTHIIKDGQRPTGKGDIVVCTVTQADGGKSAASNLSKAPACCSQVRLEDQDEDVGEQLSKHWSWMSFSLLANFKLYFESNNNSTRRCGHPSESEQANLREKPHIIRCLNGIRVLSLCWVIIANSYITLDPRATKRLTKTREAPRDFLFQMVVQASLAIETFFFLSGILMSLSFANRFVKTSPQSPERRTKTPAKDTSGHLAIRWIHFYLHRYVRMTPATMLVIAFSMFAYRYGDGPLWFEATHKAHDSCRRNWWRHLLHVANFIDTRQMCFIHYWYIAADMQLFLFAPIFMLLLYKRPRLGLLLMAILGGLSIAFVFFTTYTRNLPPTLLFYNSDPESRREFGNTIMTNPLTHVLPYMVGMLVGKLLISRPQTRAPPPGGKSGQQPKGVRLISLSTFEHQSMAAFLGSMTTMVALVEIFLPYRWNNSLLPTKFLSALYAALFRFAWSLALAYLVISCRHKRSDRCHTDPIVSQQANDHCAGCCHSYNKQQEKPALLPNFIKPQNDKDTTAFYCTCGSGGNLVNRLLSLNIFTYLSKLSFVAYLIHLPLMSVFVSQTRSLFAFSHTLVIHLAMSYLVMTFILSFVLVHIIEFPFITFERYLFQKFFYSTQAPGCSSPEASKLNSSTTIAATTCSTTTSAAANLAANSSRTVSSHRLPNNNKSSWPLAGGGGSNRTSYALDKRENHHTTISSDANEVNELELTGYINGAYVAPSNVSRHSSNHFSQRL